MIKIEILPADFFSFYTLFFTSTNEGKSQNLVLNRLFHELDKQARKIYGKSYAIHIENLRKEIAKQQQS